MVNPNEAPEGYMAVDCTSGKSSCEECSSHRMLCSQTLGKGMTSHYLREEYWWITATVACMGLTLWNSGKLMKEWVSDV